MVITTLEEKFHAFLSKIYVSEQRLLQVRKEVSRQATDDRLKRVLESHLLESQRQIKNLERAFEQLRLKPIPAPSQHIDGLVAEGRELLISSTDNPILLDCVLAEFQSTIELIQVSCYRELIMAAQWLGQTAVVELLEQNLRQEESAVKALENLAPSLLQKLASNPH